MFKPRCKAFIGFVGSTGNRGLWDPEETPIIRYDRWTPINPLANSFWISGIILECRVPG